MTQLLTILAGIIKIVPILDKWFSLLVSAYTERQKSELKKESVDAVEKMVVEKDQRPVEKLINPEGAGKASNLPGSIIRARRHDK